MADHGMDMDGIEKLAADNTPEAKQKLTELAGHVGLQVDPNDDAMTIWNKVKAKGEGSVDELKSMV